MKNSARAKSNTFKLRRSATKAIPGFLVIGIVTLICFGLHVNYAVAGFLYLIIVVLHSLLGDFVSSAVVSVIADLCLNFFFIPPIYSLRVSDSSDTWALIAFLITGLVITSLTARAQQESRTSETQRQHMKSLYELAQSLLALDPRDEVLAKSVSLFNEVFCLRAACIYDGLNAELYTAGHSKTGLAESTRAAYISQQDNDDGDLGILTRVLRTTGKVRGAIGFDGLRDADLTAGSLTALAAAIMERAYVFRDASQAVAATQAEVFRGAILDALAHEFKTPLATILAAAGGLRETGGLRPEQVELAELAETEASRLGELSSRLLQISRLDREDVKPQLELTNFSALVTDLTVGYAERWPDRKIGLSDGLAPAAVLADAKLLRLAVGQLLDNAIKYSDTLSPITISIASRDGSVALRVHNAGKLIAASERGKIFDRFYRGTEARQVAPGSGLGLYVARKIAQAHGGTLELETESAMENNDVAFCLSVPLAKSDT